LLFKRGSKGFPLLNGGRKREPSAALTRHASLVQLGRERKRDLPGSAPHLIGKGVGEKKKKKKERLSTHLERKGGKASQHSSCPFETQEGEGNLFTLSHLGLRTWGGGNGKSRLSRLSGAEGKRKRNEDPSERRKKVIHLFFSTEREGKEEKRKERP